MRVLVSVSDAAEARTALDAGADVIDAKDPRAGALGAVSIDTLHAIHGVVNGVCPVSVALGDAVDEREIEDAARRAALLGSAFVKLAFGGQPTHQRIMSLIHAARRGVGNESAPRCLVVAAAYADWDTTGLGPSPACVIAAAGRAGAAGVLIDTADKRGPALFGCATRETLHGWVEAAHAAGLWVALAGRLREADLVAVSVLGADIVGVRGAVCEGGRTGRVSADLVRRVMAQARKAAGGAAPFGAIRADPCQRW